MRRLRLPCHHKGIDNSHAHIDPRDPRLSGGGRPSQPPRAGSQDLRASIISVGLAVQREMEVAVPDFDFLIGINENIAAGLSSQG